MVRVIVNGHGTVDISFSVYSEPETRILGDLILLVAHRITDLEPPGNVCVMFITAEPSSGANNNA